MTAFLFLTVDADDDSFGLLPEEAADDVGFFVVVTEEDFEGLDDSGPLPNKSSSDPSSLSGLPNKADDKAGFFVDFPGLKEVGLGGPVALVLGGLYAPPPPPNKSSSAPAGGLPNNEDEEALL